MALLSKTGSFIKKSDTTGNQSITGIGFQPKLVFFFGNDRTSDGAHAHAQAFFGIADFTASEPGNDAFLSFKDNVATSVGVGGLAVVRMELGTDVDGSLISQGTFVSMDSDGFTINWNAQDNEARVICYLALGGDDISNSNTFSMNVGTSTGNWSPTGLGFQPNFLMLFNTSSQDTDNSIGLKDVWGGFGATAEDLSQAYMAFFAQHNTAAASAIAHRNLKPDLGFGQITGSQRLEGTVTSFNASGFTINWGTHDTYPAITQGLALNGNLRTKVGTFQQRTNAGRQTISGLPFKPKGIIFFSAQNTGTSIANDMQNMWGFADDNGDNSVVWWGASHQQNPTVADSYLDRTKAIKFMTQGTPTLLAEAEIAEMGNGYFTVDWTTADANARHIGYIAFGEDIATDSLAVGNQSQATGATTNQLTWSHTVDNNNNRVLIVDVAGWGARTVTGVTFNGDALTQIDRRSNGFGFVESWVLANPDVATGNIVVSFSGSSYSNAGAIDFFNANPNNPIGATAQDGAGTGTITDDLTTLHDNSFVVDSVWRRGGPTITPDSPQGQFYNSIFLGGVLTGAGSFKEAPTAGSTTMSWTGGVSDWMTLVFEVRQFTEFEESTQTVQAKARIVVFEEQTQTIQAKANITTFVETEQSIQSKANISFIEKTILVSPPNLSVDLENPITLVWKIPRTSDESPINAHIQIDDTDDTFGSLEAELFSYQGNFEYWDGDSWEPYPIGGVSNDYAGNQARVQVTLTPGTKYWRARGGRG